MAFGTVGIFYHSELNVAFSEAAEKYVIDNFKIDRDGAEFAAAVNEHIELIRAHLAAMPTEAYKFFYSFMTRAPMADVADIKSDSPIAELSASSFTPYASDYQLVDFIDAVSEGIGFRLKNPKKSSKWYNSQFPNRKKEISRIKAEIERAVAERNAEYKQEEKAKKTERNIKAREYKSYMKALKKHDRERYNKLSALHKIEDRQRKRFEKLSAELHKAQLKLMRYTELEKVMPLDKDEIRAMNAARSALGVAKIRLEGYKVNLQQQLSVLLDKGVIRSEYYAIRAAQIEEADFSYHAMDSFDDALHTSQLSDKHLGNDNAYYRNLKSEIMSAEYSTDIMERCAIEEPSRGELLCLYDTQLEIANGAIDIRRDRSDKDYRAYMTELKKTADPKLYRLLVNAHKRDDAQNRQYAALESAIDKARREQYRFELMLNKEPQNGKLLSRLEELNKEVRNLESTISTFKTSILKDLDRRYENKEINSTYKILRAHQIESGDLTYRPMHDWAVAKNNGQYPAALETASSETELNVWFDSMEAEIFPDAKAAASDVPENEGTLINFASYGIVFGPKTRNGSEMDIEIEENEKLFGIGRKLEDEIEIIDD